MTALVAIAADALVAILLVATIASAASLSRRIARLRADESAMRQTIGDLMLATETAERAIGGLRTTLSDCDRTLAERLRTAERYAADLAEGIEAGQTVLGRIAQIVASAAGAPGGAPSTGGAPGTGSAPSTGGAPGTGSAPAADGASAPARPVAHAAPAPSAAVEPRPVSAGERLGAAAAAARALTERALSRLEGRAA